MKCFYCFVIFFCLFIIVGFCVVSMMFIMYNLLNFLKKEKFDSCIWC